MLDLCHTLHMKAADIYGSWARGGAEVLLSFLGCKKINFLYEINIKYLILNIYKYLNVY